MKSIVVYESKYGSTERYAKWIGEELDSKVSKIEDISTVDLLNYDNIIFGGWLHAGTIKGFKNIYKDIDKFKSKNLIVFYVGLSIMDEKIYEEVKKNNFHDVDNIKQFYLRGAFNYNNLNISDKLMMNVFKRILKKQKEDEMDENTKGMLDAYVTPVDFTDKENIKPIIKSVKELNLQ
ncbi:flavodoxin domain-containing protein [Terrisporobacter petrolearius]|uniref:flavodoxin domain-containing protein n=1 Tax=Terrisporobacter petrolearius TaxID=1460447 RepID=UPI0031CC4996